MYAGSILITSTPSHRSTIFNIVPRIFHLRFSFIITTLCHTNKVIFTSSAKLSFATRLILLRLMFLFHILVSLTWQYFYPCKHTCLHVPFKMKQLCLSFFFLNRQRSVKSSTCSGCDRHINSSKKRTKKKQSGQKLG